MRNYYKVDEVGGIYWVKLSTLDGLPFFCPQSSFNILKARILNLDYQDFLYYARNNFNATLKGTKGYIVEFFKNRKDAESFCKVLNKRFNKILDEREKKNNE